jgi:hypothetical protein
LDVVFVLLLLQVMLYTIFPAIALGAGLMWLRLRQLDRLSKSLLNSFNVCKAAVLANTMDEQARNSVSVVSLMGDLKRVHRFKDVRQVSHAAVLDPNLELRCQRAK